VYKNSVGSVVRCNNRHVSDVGEILVYNEVKGMVSQNTIVQSCFDLPCLLPHCILNTTGMSQLKIKNISICFMNHRNMCRLCNRM
jgi:hypothetical protein